MCVVVLFNCVDGGIKVGIIETEIIFHELIELMKQFFSKNDILSISIDQQGIPPGVDFNIKCFTDFIKIAVLMAK